MISREEQAGGSMNYGMIGEDDSTDGEKLAKFMGEVDWSYLKPHYERGSLFFVDAAVEMTEVGEAMAKDDADACLLYTSPSPRDKRQSRMPSSA